MLSKQDLKIKWFQQAGFGLFIHWGLYTATEGRWNGKETTGIGEWIQSREKIPGSEYEKLAPKLTCEKFDPSYWARLAKRAGMKYCVFTSKHHEGFAMFDTSYDDYSIVKRSLYGKDVTKAVVEAMRKEGIIPCLYYSQALDFHEENAWGNTWDYFVPEPERDMWSYINGKCKYQLKELLTGYGKIGMLWMDVPRGLTDEMALEIKKLVHEKQPECLISGRITYSNQMGDFGCYGDNQIPAGQNREECWETAATMNNTWGYKRDDHHYKSVKEILELLCDLRAKGTNLLLNIGPKPDGSLTPETVAILEALGDWYEINGESISGTDASPFDCDVSFGGISRKENILYLYVYGECESIDLYGIENKVLAVRVLGGDAVYYEQEEKGEYGEEGECHGECHGEYYGLLHIDLRKVQLRPNVTVVKVVLDGVPAVKGGIRQQEKGKLILPAYACQIKRVIFDKDKTDSPVSEGNAEVFQAEGNIEDNAEKPESKDVKSTSETDAALLADVRNTEEEADISVDVAGIVQNWKSERHCLQWEFEVEEAREYAAYLYTVTEKYKSWKGGHRVHLEGEQTTHSKSLTADRQSRGANQKYYAETGSFLGNIQLKEGKNVLKLLADCINRDDPAGLSVSKLVLTAVRTENVFSRFTVSSASNT